MFKKIISCILCLALCFSFISPVLAKPSDLESELTNLALKIKNTLDISDDFSNFTSSVNDSGVFCVWSLNWANKGDYVRATVDKTGRVLSYNCSNNSTYVYRRDTDFAPKFTKEQYLLSKAAAIDFLNRVLGENESFDFNNTDDTYSTYLPDRFSFSGTVKLNNLKSPFVFSISVDSSNYKVLSFYRDYFGNNYVNYVPTSIPKFDDNYAKSLLSTTHSFKLEYEVDYSEPTKIAKLYYLPIEEHDYYVDALSGKLVNRDDLFPISTPLNAPSLDKAVGDAKLNGAVEMTRELTQIELRNIAKLRDVLTKEELDSLLKSKEELGLSKYTLTSLRYSTNEETNDVYCNVTYSCSNDFESLGIQEKDIPDIPYNLNISKYIELNAKTGQIESLHTSYPYIMDYDNLNKNLKEGNYHIDFLNACYKDLFNKTKLYNSSSSNFSKSFVYCQNENGYFLRINCLNISVNQRTGYIDTFFKSWDDNIKFEDSNNIITLDAAKKLFYDACTTSLSYIYIPTEITENIELYDSLGYSYLYKLCLAYKLQNPQNVYKIHAKTGKFINSITYTKNLFTYSDIDNCYAKDRILLLADHGIGFEYNKFDPNKNLTQLDALVFLVNSLGYCFDVANLDLGTFSNLYSIAYRYNFIKPNEKEPLKPLSRAEFVKMLISASSYKNVAHLKNIFKCDFNDASNIHDEDLGYVCVARSLGIIVGDENFNFNPNSIATRLDACNILYNFITLN